MNTYDAVREIGMSANKLAMISDISEMDPDPTMV